MLPLSGVRFQNVRAYKRPTDRLSEPRCTFDRSPLMQPDGGWLELDQAALLESPTSMDGSGRSSRSRAERVLFVRQQQAINASHAFPVVFVGSSTDEADLIVLAIAVESWPTKLMGAQIAKESLKESHVCCSLPRGAKLGGATCSEKWRVNRFDYFSGTLSNYGSALEVRVTA
jgi:hypothetical protein